MGDWILVEGQGAIDHPAYSSVTLGLIHGCAPHAMVMVHQPGRTHHHGWEGTPYELRSMRELIPMHEQLAGLVAPSIVAAVALNTSLLDEGAARREIAPHGRRARPAMRRPVPLRWRAADGRPRASGWHEGRDRRSSSCPSATRSGSPGRCREHGATTVIGTITTDDGATGVGEGYPDAYYGETPETMEAVVPVLVRCGRRDRCDAGDAVRRSASGSSAHRSPWTSGSRTTARPSAWSTSPSTTSPASGSACHCLNCWARRVSCRRPTTRSASTNRRWSPSEPLGRPSSRRSRSSSGGPPISRRSRPCAASTAGRSASTPTPAGRLTSPSALLPECVRLGVELIEQPFKARRLDQRAGSRNARRCPSWPTRARSRRPTSMAWSASSRGSTSSSPRSAESGRRCA